MVTKQDIENSFYLCMNSLYNLRISNEFPILKDYEGRHFVEAEDITKNFTRDEFVELARRNLKPLIADTLMKVGYYMQEKFIWFVNMCYRITTND